ncbi:MAG: DUF4350 domain-containing protein [Myxococcales bacterium]|nr:DUF4350 domain-containing protein [Myxococcales bacterium]
MDRAHAIAALLPLALAGCTGDRQPEAPAQGPAAPAAGVVHVIVDQSLDQVSSPFDSGFDGLSQLTALLREHGATVSTNNRPLDAVAPRWGAGHVLVLGIPWGRGYDAAVREALDGFMRRGGGVLVLSEHDNMYGSSDAHNGLTARYGIRTLGGAAQAPERAGEPTVARWPQVRAARFGIADARLFWPAPLSVDPPAKPLLQLVDPADPARAVVGALAPVGEGRLAVVADLELFWNMAPRGGLSAGDNRRLALELFGLLAGRDGALSGPAVRPVLPQAPAAAAPCVRFERSGGALYPDGAPNGLTRLARRLAARGLRVVAGRGTPRCERVVVAAPLSMVDPEVTRARRLLVIGDGRTDFARAERALLEPLPLDLARGWGPDPYASLLHGTGIALPRATLLSRHQGLRGRAQRSDGGGQLALHRAGALQVDDGVRVLARAAGLRATHNLTPAHRAGGGQQAELSSRPPRPAAPELASGNDAIVAAHTERVMVIADLELVSDQSADGALLKAIAEWLGGRG